MNLRAIGSTILGLVLWQVLFTVIGIAAGQLWPAYRLAARTFFDTRDFSQFTTPMMLTNMALFAAAGLLAGWIATRIGRTQNVGYAMAGIAFAYAAFQHFYLLWGNLPDWYNMVVPWVIGGSIVLGTRISASPRSTPT